MILLLGASGYFGRAFAGELRRRGHAFIPLTRRVFDYTRFDFLFDYLRRTKPVFLINAANYAGPAADTPGDAQREQAMAANALLPQMIARVCLMTKTTWGHLSSGSVYTGCKITEHGETRIEKDLARPEIRRLFASQPEAFRGFTEEDPANFSFRHPPCGFYSGTKALAEEAIQEISPRSCYIWRLRLPFSDRDEPCNLLCQPPELIDDAINSLSHLEDCVKACLDLWETKAPLGIYNVTNPGAVAVREILDEIPHVAQGRQAAAARPADATGRTLRSNCILDVSKLVKCGIRMRPVEEALRDSLAALRSNRRPGRPSSPQ